MRKLDSSPNADWIEHTAIQIPHPLECLNISVCTTCSLTCRFCAYRVSRIPQTIMPNDRFYSVIDQAVLFGYRIFNLTPLLGEVLLDPGFLEKIDYLENQTSVKSYFFSTNLTHADEKFFAALDQTKKCQWFSVSLYSLNSEDYLKMTGADEEVFSKTIENLKRMCGAKTLAGRSEIRVRGPGPRKAASPSTEVTRVLDQLHQQGTQIRSGVRVMNWGGVIKKRDIIGLDLEFKSAKHKQTLPCVFLFHKPNILPDLRVNACSCGDAHAQLSIGNLENQTFSDIFSIENETYLEILQGHFSGNFPSPCKACSGYRSLDKTWYSYQYYDRGFISVQKFFDWLSHQFPSKGTNNPEKKVWIPGRPPTS